MEWRVATNIKEAYFQGWPSLETAVFDKVTNIEGSDYGAFRDCPNLKTVVLKANTVCQISTAASNLFKNSTHFQSGGDGQIVVPDNLVNYYKSDSSWSSVADNIIGESDIT